MQQARIKWLSYSSRIQWEQFIEKYFSKDYDGIRLYENMDGLVQVSTKNIPVRNREEVYSSNLNEHKSSTNNLSFATEGRYTFHKKNKRIVTVSIDKEDLKLLPHGNRTHSGSRDRREPIMITLTDLLNAANEMRTIVPGDYCYDVLNRNTIKAVDNHAIAPCQYLSIHEVVNIAGLAASRIGTQKILFFEHVINQADVVLFDESDRVQKTLDDFFAPNISFLEFMESQADACAKDMKREPDAPETDVNATRYYDLVKSTLTFFGIRFCYRYFPFN